MTDDLKDFKNENFTLLLVDDHAFVLKGLKRYFSTHFNTEVATSIDEAQVILKGKTVGIIVVDQHMPMGVELLEHVTMEFYSTRRIMLTSDRHPDTLLDVLLKELAHGVVYKPYDKKKLGIVVVEQADIFRNL
jgi:DNA-binding NarL/FixJ family response regulator